MADCTLMTWHVYIVRCADDTLYTGIAIEVERRIAEHNGSGRAGARYTRARRPVALAYQEGAASRSDAAKREYAIKRMSRGQKLALIARKAKRKPGPPRRPAPTRVSAPPR